VGTPRDLLDAILDKEGAEEKLQEYDQQRMSVARQMNPTLYVAGNSTQSIILPNSSKSINVARRGSSQCSQERVQKVQARGASMARLKQQKLNQDSDARLSAEEVPREL